MKDRPNIIWLMTDEQRCDSLGCYGSPWARSPHLDQLARRATVFDQAYTPSPVCVPARVAMLTGYAPSTCGVLSIHHQLADQHARFLTDHFADAGYQTASFGKQHYNNANHRAFQTEQRIVLGDHVAYFRYKTEVDHDEAGVVQYPGDERSRWLLAGRYPGTLDDLPEAQVVRESLRWLDERDANRPFLLRLSFNGPHTPVVAPAPYDTMIDPDAIDLPVDRWGQGSPLPPSLHRTFIERTGIHRLNDSQVQRIRQCYYGLVTALDELLGRFIEQAGRLIDMENTIIVLCADHGTHLGDHGCVQKQSYCEESVRVPFMFAGPGIHPHRRIATPVNVGSLMPTLLAMAGLNVPTDISYPPLADALCRGSEPPSTPIISEIDLVKPSGRAGDRYVMIRHDRWKLCLFRDPLAPDHFIGNDERMLFDLQADPTERHNLAHSTEHQPIMDQLITMIDQWDSAVRLRRRG